MPTEPADLLTVPGYRSALAMSSEVIEEVVSADGERRALIRETGDGRVLVEVEHRVPGDGVSEPRAYWSRTRQPVTVTDTLESARRLAVEAIGGSRPDGAR